MKRLFSTLFVATGAVVLAVSVLAGLSIRNRARRARPLESREMPPGPEAALNPNTIRNFSIRRTKSEVGYVYWILEGYGRYKCFILCDTWDEAMALAQAKLAEDAPVTA